MVSIVSRTHVTIAAPTSRFTAFRALLTASLTAEVQVRLGLSLPEMAKAHFDVTDTKKQTIQLKQLNGLSA